MGRASEDGSHWGYKIRMNTTQLADLNTADGGRDGLVPWIQMESGTQYAGSGFHTLQLLADRFIFAEGLGPSSTVKPAGVGANPRCALCARVNEWMDQV